MMVFIRLSLTFLVFLGLGFSALKIRQVWLHGDASLGLGSSAQPNVSFGFADLGKPFWQKESLIVPSDLWKVRDLQRNLHEGDSYFVLEEVEPNRMCLLGRFKLFQLSDEKLTFRGDKLNRRSRLEQFAFAHRVPLRVSVITGSQLSEHAVLNACSEWFHAQNF